MPKSIELKQKQTIKTRKDHQCQWCGTTIRAGSGSYYKVYFCDGQIAAGHMHIDCHFAWQLASIDPEQDLEDGWYPGDYSRGCHRPVNDNR